MAASTSGMQNFEKSLANGGPSTHGSQAAVAADLVANGRVEVV